MSDPSASRLVIEPLRSDHELEDFDCGSDDLNRFLKRHALINQKAETARTYVACRGCRVVGYYSLAVGSVIHAEASKRVTKGLARHPVPVMLLARLAIDYPEHGQGIGAGLLKNALLRTVQAADLAGIGALLVHAKDEAAAAFYRHFNFDPSPTDPLHLFLLMKDVRRILGS